MSVTVQRPPGIKASTMGIDGGIEVPMGLMMIDGIVLTHQHLGILLKNMVLLKTTNLNMIGI